MVLIDSNNNDQTCLTSDNRKEIINYFGEINKSFGEKDLNTGNYSHVNKSCLLNYFSCLLI
ncbi:MAG: hypothetical protein AB1782_13530 [Cyanobacteriota bacterium]